jgi:Na+-translocating ferredoxin:NAD+ oxidoreductase RNF subunit RnfB
MIASTARQYHAELGQRSVRLISACFTAPRAQCEKCGSPGCRLQIGHTTLCSPMLPS